MELAEQRAGIKTHLFTVAETAMSRHSMHTLGRIFGLILILAAGPALAQTRPMLFTLSAGTPTILGPSVQKSWPIKVDEGRAFDAVFKGGMWLPNPSGGRIYAKYQRHILHDNGTWTWIGTVSTVHGDKSVVLTFGKGVVFGLVPQASGYPLRIVTRAGETQVIETSAAMSRSTQQLRLHSKPDFFVPPPAAPANRVSALSASSSVPVQAAASGGPVTIDIMVAYTSGFVSELGSQHAALTRIQNLVDITNQAYTASGVNQQIRLVHTVEVNYPDNTSNDTALDELTGLDPNRNPVPIPASLQGIASLRVQYGADLVALIRSYDNATQGNCGIGWLVGGNQTPIKPSDDNIWGYNVVSDGSSGGYYCLDTTFAHELGHNMGDAHDRAHATDEDGNPVSGAYLYSYGYLGNGTNGFSTIMSYGTDTDTPLSVFSNPNISICQNTPCGVADSSSSSADNVHSMNNTAALIAQFEPTMVGSPVPRVGRVHDDVDGDGKSDLIWRAKNNAQFAYWLMNGAQLGNTAATPVSAKYKLVATGDLDGDGKTDLIWMTSGRIAEWLMDGTDFSASYAQNLSSGWRYLTAGDFDGDGKADLLLTNGSAMQMWTNFNSGSFTQVATHTYPSGWTILGAGDVNGDGKDDLLWRDNPHTRFAYWLMSGPQLGDSKAISVSAQWHFGTAGDFDGDGLLGLVWYNNSQIVMWPGSSTGNYQGAVVHSYPGAWAMLP